MSCLRKRSIGWGKLSHHDPGRRRLKRKGCLLVTTEGVNKKTCGYPPMRLLRCHAHQHAFFFRWLNIPSVLFLTAILSCCSRDHNVVPYIPHQNITIRLWMAGPEILRSRASATFLMYYEIVLPDRPAFDVSVRLILLLFHPRVKLSRFSWASHLECILT